MPFMFVIFIKFCSYRFPSFKRNRLVQCTLATCIIEDFLITGLLAVERTTSTAEEQQITLSIQQCSVLLSFTLYTHIYIYIYLFIYLFIYMYITLESLLRITIEQVSQSTSTRTSGSSKGLLWECENFKIP